MMAAVADLAAWEEPAAAVRAVVKTAAEVAATAAGSTVPLLNSAIQAADGWRCSPSFIVLTTTPCGIAAISSTVEPCTGRNSYSSLFVLYMYCGPYCGVGRSVPPPDARDELRTTENEPRNHGASDTNSHHDTRPSLHVL